MSAPIAARLAADSTAPPTLGNRIHVFLVQRRVAISMALFSLLAIAEVALFRRRPHDILNPGDAYSWAGVTLVLAGLVVRSWAAGTLRKHRQLITSGPYALVRNPLYVGSFLMMAGFCLLVGHPLMSVFVIGPMIVLYALAVRDEEQLLARLFPDAWPGYTARVPRLLPRLALPTSEGWSLAQWRHNHEYNAWLGAVAALGGLRIWWMLMG